MSYLGYDDDLLHTSQSKVGLAPSVNKVRSSFGKTGFPLNIDKYEYLLFNDSLGRGDLNSHFFVIPRVLSLGLARDFGMRFSFSSVAENYI